MTKNSIAYFGYGANRTLEMMNAIIGRSPKGKPAYLKDYELVVQKPDQISQKIRKMIGNHRSPEEVNTFETYAIRPKKGKTVHGTLWYITREERELVDNWELNDGFWYTKKNVVVMVGDQNIVASTEIIDDPNLWPVSENDKEAPAFLNNEARMLEVAEVVRAEFLREKNLVAHW